MAQFLRFTVLWISFVVLMASKANSEDRLAFIIDVTNYDEIRKADWDDPKVTPLEWIDLETPKNDGDLIEEVLKEVGFEVKRITDPSQSEAETAIAEFSETVSKATDDAVVLVFFAGHGFQSYDKALNDNENFLVPRDANISFDWHIRKRTLPLSEIILNVMHPKDENTKYKNRVYTFIIDACRVDIDLPTSSKVRSVRKRGLAQRFASKGTIIAYSTAPGELASDGETNSPYALSLARNLTKMPYLVTALNAASHEVEGQSAWVNSLGARPVLLRPEGKIIAESEIEARNQEVVPKSSVVFRKPLEDKQIVNARDFWTTNGPKILIETSPDEILKLSGTFSTNGRELEIRAHNLWVDGEVKILNYPEETSSTSGLSGSNGTNGQLKLRSNSRHGDPGMDGLAGAPGNPGEDGFAAGRWVIDAKNRLHLSGTLSLLNRGTPGGIGGKGGDGGSGSPGGNGRNAIDHMLRCEVHAGDGGRGGDGGNGGRGGNGGDGGIGGDIQLLGLLRDGKLGERVRFDVSGGAGGSGGEGGFGGKPGQGGQAGANRYCIGAEPGPSGKAGMDGEPGKDGNPGLSGKLL